MEKLNLTSAGTAEFSLGDFLVSLQGKPQMTKPVQTRVSQCWHHWHFGLDNSLLGRLVLGFAGCCAEYLSCTHQMLWVPLPALTTENLSRHC